MFEQAAVMEMHRGNRTWTTLAGMTMQAALLATAVVVPMMSPEALPNYRTLMTIFTPTAPPPPPPPAPAETRATTPVETRTQAINGRFYEPRHVPPKPVIIEDPPDAPAIGGGVPGGVVGGTVGGSINGIIGGILTAAATNIALPAKPVPAASQQAAAAPAAKPAEVKQIRQGGQVQEALLINRVIPTYPVLARQARIQGVVELMGVVATDGRIKELRVVSGHPLLAPAALDAVRQWIYRPTYLNGTPVEVVAPITVHFTLQ